MWLDGICNHSTVPQISGAALTAGPKHPPPTCGGRPKLMRPLQSRAFEVNLSGADNVVCSILEPRHTLEMIPKCIPPVLFALSVQGSHNSIKKLLGQPTKKPRDCHVQAETQCCRCAKRSFMPGGVTRGAEAVRVAVSSKGENGAVLILIAYLGGGQGGTMSRLCFLG